MGKKMIYIIPLKGLTVRIPKTRSKLPENGAWVPAENYWLRRITDGSVREAVPPQVKTEEPTEVKEVKEKPSRGRENRHGN